MNEVEESSSAEPRRKRRTRTHRKKKNVLRGKRTANILYDLRWALLGALIGVPLLAAVLYLIQDI